MTKLSTSMPAALGSGLLMAALLTIASLPRSSDAQAIAYKPPSRGAPTGSARVGGGTRGPEGQVTSLSVLAPDHVGLTATSQPVLYWFTSDAIDAPVEMTLLREDRMAPVLEVALSPPLEAGIHGLDLAKHNVTLEPGVAYQWYVAVVMDPTQRSGDIVAGGEIQQMPAAPQLSDEVQKIGAAGAAGVYARAGYWYDALGALSQRVEAAPADAAVRAERAALLEQVGLADAARYEREQKL